MKKGGVGGANTQVGLLFEDRVKISDLFRKLVGYSVSGNKIFFGKELVAELYGKHAIYKEFLSPKGVDYRKFLSKRLVPDEAVFVPSTNKLYVVEMKFQHGPGSVDEKLQTCDFKLKQYRKLFSPLKTQVMYVYVLNDWFQKPEYKDTLDYVKSVGCGYFFNKIPLSYFGLPEEHQ